MRTQNLVPTVVPLQVLSLIVFFHLLLMQHLSYIKVCSVFSFIVLHDSAYVVDFHWQIR